ncbi:MAG: DUF2784 domain-containing protein [Kiritimatiellae bacterium]|nr:DUF2784 domain-containing protein [Kiritimatiellia bacterium]
MKAAAILADLILVLHFGYIAFIVGGQLLILIGGWWRWRWVRHRGFRLLHLGAIAFVTLEAWLGLPCPLTVWEDRLRRVAGQPGYQRSFLYDWIGRFIYFDASPITFAIAYTLFGLIIVASWRLIPPNKKSIPAAPPP